MTSRLKRILTAGLAAVGLAAALTPTTAAAQAVTLDVLYCYPSFARFHEPLAAEYMKRNPNVKIQFRAPAASYDEGHQVMLRSAVTNQLPDVYYAGYHLLGEMARTLAKRNQIVDLQPLLKAEPAAFVTSNYAPRMMSLAQVDGRQYGMAFNASSPIMYFNTELVQRAGGDPKNMPTTWDGLVALAGKIKALGGDVNGMSYDVHAWPDDWLFQGMLYQQGGKLVEPGSKKAGFNNAVGLNALRTMRRFVTEGGMQLVDWDQSRQQFGAGKTGILFSTPAHLKIVGDMVGNRFPLGTARFPLDDKAGGGVPTGGNAVVILTRDAARQKAAWDFVKFVTSPEAQKIVVEMTGYLPTNQRAIGAEFLGPFYDKNPNFRTATTQIDRSLPWGGYPGGQSVRIWRAQRDVVASVMRGEKTPEAALPELVKATESLME
ncbi:MAG TPA: ABC transporter substrate-binding protein [Burkholderiaceae bacterium]|jgi:multiple sugar transport system substrate-binding protein|nr:ABC transporter substrate-binding protein [Burkholderiaceae bacterium]